jgi:hypothetical protein
MNTDVDDSLLGVVGLAIARHLSLAFPDKSTFLVERHKRVGEETRYMSHHSNDLSIYNLHSAHGTQRLFMEVKHFLPYLLSSDRMSRNVLST